MPVTWESVNRNESTVLHVRLGFDTAYLPFVEQRAWYITYPNGLTFSLITIFEGCIRDQDMRQRKRGSFVSPTYFRDCGYNIEMKSKPIAVYILVGRKGLLTILLLLSNLQISM